MRAIVGTAGRQARWLQSLIVLAAAFVLLQSASAQTASAEPDLQVATNGLWRDIVQQDVTTMAMRTIEPARYRLVALDHDVFAELFSQAPMEGSEAARTAAVVVTLPLPDGGVGRFKIVETEVMAPELAAKFPEIRTWAGQGLDDPGATVRLDWTPQGFHAMVLSATTGRIFVDPYSRGDTVNYVSYFSRDHQRPDRTGNFETAPHDPGGLRSAQIQSLMAIAPQKSSGTQLRKYRLAVAATGEYTAYHGGTKLLGQAAIVTAVNRVTGIYEVEVAVRLQLVGDNDKLVYTNAVSDPYTNADGSTMLEQNQQNIDMVIGSANYDIGHVFSTGGGGVAWLGVPCNAGEKARGVTGSSQPTGDNFWVDYVAHEMGHQFGGNHSFNGIAGACGGNGNPSTAYEPGSGSTIMAYAGICGSDDLQPHSDAYFHSVNFDEIVTYTTVGSGNSCPVITATGNNLPVSSVGPGGFTIPASTPFALAGSATDADGDMLTYNWEEYDLGPGGPPGVATSAPFFRSWPSTTSPTRTFPALSNLLANTLAKGEVLPSLTRPLNFRMTVRDNRVGGGGVVYSTLAFNVTSAAGPFKVTSPNTNVVWPGGSSQVVTWDVAGTTAAPVSCPSVDILLSTDGGLTFPVVLIAETANDGTQAVTAPNTASTGARIKVLCSNNIFFDLSDTSFVITASIAPTVLTNAATAVMLPNAILNGSVSSNGAVTTVIFQYGITASYGSSVTATQSPLAGSAVSTPVSATISGLTCGTLYHFRAVGTNVAGTVNGSDMSFSTPACPVTAPTVMTNAATLITVNGARLNGTVSSNGAASAVTFQYGITVSYGSSVTATQSPLAGSAVSTPVSATIGGLACGTLYHFRATAANSAATSNGGDATFTTAACPITSPSVSGSGVTGVGASGATGTSSVTSNGGVTTVSFQYGLTTGYGSSVVAAQSPLAANASGVAVSAAIGGLTCNTLYHLRAVATNSAGTTNGADVSFVTAGCAPTVTTNAASGVTINAATLNGAVSSNGVSTTVKFEYGPTASYGTTVTAAQSPLAANAGNALVTAAINGLACNTLYHFRAVGTNSVGTSNGIDATFTTGACPVLNVSLLGTGAGSVASTNVAGIACGADCSETYATGTLVALTATPLFGSAFSGWGGACSGTGTCSVTIAGATAVNATFTFTGSAFAYDYVQKSYVAYYGRPADPPGQAYWANRVDAAGGSIDAIINAFGNSQEFNQRYGGLDYAQLVTKVYQQTLGREPDPAGLAFYVGELQSGRRTLQTITLDVLNGATTAPDSTVLANKLQVAAYYSTKVAQGCPYGTEMDGVNSIAGVTAAPSTVTAAKAAIDVRCSP